MDAPSIAAGIAYQEHRPAGAPGPALILLHGAGGTSAHWPEAIRRLPRQRVIALDLPAHGQSPGPSPASVPAHAARVTALCDALGLRSAVFAGHSMGGAIALTVALQAPERVAGLVLVATGARLRVHPAVLEATADPTRLAAAAREVAAWSFGPGADGALIAPFVEGFLASAPGVAHADFAACDAFDVMARLGEVAAPALVICGDEDRLTPPKYAEHLRGAIRGGRLVRVPGAGHMVMLEAPQVVAGAIDTFLGELG